MAVTNGIVGYGILGKATAGLCNDTVAIYDPYIGYESLKPLANCDYIFICVPTPASTKGHDISAILDFADRAYRVLGPKTIVIRSTVTPGTTDHCVRYYPEWQWLYVPEFRTEEQLKRKSAPTIPWMIGRPQGASNEAVLPTWKPQRATSATAAEFGKLLINCALATQVSLAHEMQEAADRYNIEWDSIREILNLDGRVGTHWTVDLQDQGYGGKCLPKDMEAMMNWLTAMGLPSVMLEGTFQVNRMFRGEETLV
jgi:UDP-glucose 6-dehydrogenase